MLNKANFIRLLGCCFIAIFTMLSQQAIAKDSEVLSISPSSVQQGDTVLLTIAGEKLPTGTVVVEFFPQQIAVLNILSAEKSELIIQVKVPSMAPPGQYNILVFNHLGEEAFGEAVLTVGSDLITPIFEEYDPKTIADASGGFAVMMTGTLITQDAVNQLEMDWYIGDELMKGLQTEFALANVRTVVCAVSGELMGGTLRGRVLLNKTPIYMVEIEMELDRAMLIGATPSLISVNETPYTLKLLGMGVSEIYTDTLSAVLKSEVISADAESIVFKDEASINVTFPGPLPVGEYTLEVTSGGQPEYGGMVIIEDGRVVSQPIAVTENGEEEAVQDESISNTPVEPVIPDDEVEFDPVVPVEETMSVGYIISLDNDELLPGDNPARLDINCKEMESAVFERLEPKLRVGMELAELTLVSAGDDSFTYVFSPDENGWLDGQTGTLEILDPLNEVKAYRTIVTVKSHEVSDAVDEAGEYANNGSWDVLNAGVISSFSGQQLVVDIIPPNPDSETEAVSCTYTVLPDEAGIEDLFEGLNLKGELELQGKPDGSVTGTADGRFVDGDLLVKFADADGASWLATLPLTAPKIGASLVLPNVDSITVDPVSGSVEPAWLRWECRFTGVTPIEPEALSLKSSIALPEAEVLKVLLKDNGIALEIELSGLAQELSSFGNIEFWVDSSTDLLWDKSSRVSLQVQDASMQQTSVELFVQETPVVITPKGFEVKYTLSSDLEPSELSGNVEASSSLLSLDWNISGFNIKTEVLSLPTGSIVIVEFIRDPVVLDEAAYSILTSELTGVGMVDLKLHWQDSGVKDSSQVRFSK